MKLSLEQQIAIASRQALIATMRAAVVYVLDKATDAELRETILTSVVAKDFPREVASAVLEASAKVEA